jgi:hypothetical protein
MRPAHSLCHGNIALVMRQINPSIAIFSKKRCIAKQLTPFRGRGCSTIIGRNPPGGHASPVEGGSLLNFYLISRPSVKRRIPALPASPIPPSARSWGRSMRRRSFWLHSLPRSRCPHDRHDGADLLNRHVAEVGRQHRWLAWWHCQSSWCHSSIGWHWKGRATCLRQR